MLVASLNDAGRYGTILAAYVSPRYAGKVRQLSGDLVFNDDGTINQGWWWLFGWERRDPNSYARRAQKARLCIKGWDLYAEEPKSYSPWWWRDK